MNSDKRILKWLALTLSVTILAAPLAWSSVQQVEAAGKAKYAVGNQTFSIEGVKKNIATINKNGSTYIALRHLSDSLGLDTNFDKTTQIISISGEGRILTINLAASTVMLNGQQILSPELVSQDNTTYLPLRFILEQLGFEVGYESGSKLIAIHAIKENDLKINAQTIEADENGKSLQVYYPVISGLASSEVQQSINAFLKEQIEEQVADLSKQMDEAVSENKAINPQANLPKPSLNGKYTVTYNEKDRLSLYIDYYLDLGGAHGSTVRHTYTFDLSTGKTLTLKDVAGGNENYVAIINQKIKEQIAERVQSGELYLNTPFESIEADRDFFLNRNGIVIAFAEYEYTPYAAGMPEFVIPYDSFQ